MLILALLLFHACVPVLHKTSIEKNFSGKMQGITVTDIFQSGDQGHTLHLPQWMFPSEQISAICMLFVYVAKLS